MLCLAQNAANDINWFQVAMGLLGGLALFLLGMDQMTDALKGLAGESMRKVIAKLTGNRFMGVITGAVVTATTQSSSVTTVLLVGFISAGVMTMQQSVAVIFGANIGSTVTAQIIAFKVTQYALVLVFTGYAATFIFRKPVARRWGMILLGLGLIFLGMELMSQGTSPLREYEPFISLMRNMETPILGILVGALFTAAVQSSGATTGILIVLASQGYITLEAGIAIAFGANIGTCVTALLAAIGKPREAVQSALVHILFNIVGVLIWLPLISYLADFVREISPHYANLPDAERLAKETPRQIANAHTAFNIANTVLFIGLTGPTAKLISWILPIRETPEEGPVQPRYLDSAALESPAVALDRARLEIGRLGHCVRKMLAALPRVVESENRQELRALRDMDGDVDALHGAIVMYLGDLSRRDLTRSESTRADRLGTVAHYLENIGDIIETNMVSLAEQRLDLGFTASDATAQKLREMKDEAERAFDLALRSVTAEDRSLAKQVIEMKGDMQDLEEAIAGHLGERLLADEPNRLAAFRVESDFMEQTKRIYYFAKRIAKVMVDEEPQASS